MRERERAVSKNIFLFYLDKKMNRLVVASFILLSALNLASASPCATPELQSNFDLTAYLGKGIKSRGMTTSEI